MKFLVLIAVVIAVLWIARSAARRRRGGRAAPPPTREAMVECSVCGLHLPSSDALPGRGGVFCCEAHRAEYERAHGR